MQENDLLREFQFVTENPDGQQQIGMGLDDCIKCTQQYLDYLRQQASMLDKLIYDNEGIPVLNEFTMLSKNVWNFVDTLETFHAQMVLDDKLAWRNYDKQTSK